MDTLPARSRQPGPLAPRHDWRWDGKATVCRRCHLSFRVALALSDQICEPASPAKTVAA